MTDLASEVRDTLPAERKVGLPKIRIRIPHPALQCPKVKKRHYRSWLLLTILVIPIAHLMIPEYESFVAAFNGLVFYWEPLLEAEV